MAHSERDIVRLRRIAGNMEVRGVLLNTIRAFFWQRGFAEVETPVRIPHPANEDYIDAEPSGDWYLRTSPELHMKRLLAAGYENIYQLGPCFRAGERGRRHLSEFTMLEWYRAGAGYLDILDDCRGLVACTVAGIESRFPMVVDAPHGSAGDREPSWNGPAPATTCPVPLEGAGEKSCSPITAGAGPGGDRCKRSMATGQKRAHLSPSGTARLHKQWEILPVEEAFRQYAHADVDELIHAGRFEEVLVESVEPHLGFERPTVLIDYPASQAALARRKPGRPDRAERWELYIAGLEIANAYGELTDPAEQGRRFADSAKLRHREGREAYPVDPHFMAAMEAGLPRCAGIALGVDRLLMALLGTESIADVTAFPPEYV